MKAACWSALASLAFATTAGAQATRTSDYSVHAPGDIAREAVTQDIAFRVRNDRMTVAVRLGGKGPYRFLVDTGATRTVVSSAIAATMGLASGPVAKLHSTTGTSWVRIARVPQLELGPDRVRSVDAAVLDAAHIGADGIVGVDSLRSEKVIFDFRQRVISIVPAKRRVDEEPGTIVVRGKLRQGHLIVTGASANRVPLVALLDTGSELSMGNAALHRQLAAQGRLGPAERIAMKSVTGELLVGEAFLINKVKIGDVELHDLVVLFASAPIFRQLGLETRPALLLGMNGLQAFEKISIDFVRKQLRMTMAAEQRR